MKKEDIDCDLFSRVMVYDNREGENSYLPEIIEVDLLIMQEKSDRFKEEWYTSISIYANGSIQLLTEGIGNYINNKQLDEIQRIRELLIKDN